MPSLLAFVLSPIQWLVLLVIVLLLFGNRLPSTMRSLGQGMLEFKKGLKGNEDEEGSGSEEKEEVTAEKKG